jgi:RND family efflux transporter MFP subunit
MKKRRLLSYRDTIRASYTKIRKRIPYKKTVLSLQKRPFLSFFTAIGVLFLFILLGSIFRSLSKKAETPAEFIKTVKTYNIGVSPEVNAQARVEKSGIVKIVAQTAGIVQMINVVEGQDVNRGTQLVSLSSNYQGNDALSLASQIAYRQYRNNVDTYTTQKDVVFKQKELARKGETNTEELRKIQDQSVQDTRGLLNLNHEIVLGIEANMQTLSNEKDILAAKQLKSQFQAATDQLNNAYRNGIYQTENGLPKELSTLQKEATLAQLDLQDKAIDLQKDISGLQYQLAQINESLMLPASPMQGKVQRVYVRQGQSITPGTPLATISQSDQEITAVANIPAEIAKNISSFEDSQIILPDNKIIKLKPSYVSSEATDGQLYSVRFTLPKDLQINLTDGQFLSVTIPIGTQDTGDAVPFVPLDSVYQTQDTAYIFIVQDAKAKVKTIRLGQVYGKFVQVIAGITKGDHVILNRNVIENDKVRISN